MSVSSRRLVLCALVIGLIGASTLQAQQPGNRFQGGRGVPPQIPGQDKLQLLANEAVQKDLELADDQKADLRKVGEELRTKLGGLFEGFRDLSEAEREKKRDENTKKMESMGKDVVKKIESVLLPHQLERLQEIFVQVRGVDALNDAEIAKQLELKDDQKEKLTAVRDEIRQKMFQGGGQQQDREAMMARFAALRKEREEKSLAVLTADQKDKFGKMKGAAFDVDAAGLRFGGFGFGGQGGRPGQGGGRPGGAPGGQPRTRPGGNDNTNS